MAEACLSTVRERIKNGYHRGGDSLPVGLLAFDFKLRPKEVTEICTALRNEGLVTERGPHGPGYYVTETTSGPQPTGEKGASVVPAELPTR
ncbi:hypothetical protein ACWCQL_36735 [Streptomyces sp. NPDC002073]